MRRAHGTSVCPLMFSDLRYALVNVCTKSAIFQSTGADRGFTRP